MQKRSSSNNNGGGEARQPLSDVVADCVRRWFQDTLKKDKGEDVNMQVPVSQMYYSGYGVPKDDQKITHYALGFKLPGGWQQDKDTMILTVLQGILVLAAINRPHAIDPALMRPGRFDLHIVKILSILAAVAALWIGLLQTSIVPQSQT